MRANIVRIGNSQGIRIPKALLEESKMGTEVELTLKDDELIIRAIKNPREGWSEAFLANSCKNENTLIKEYQSITNQWDDKEWQW